MNIIKPLFRSISIGVTFSVLVSALLFPSIVNADTNSQIDGLVYEWNTEGNKYPFSSATGTSTSSADTYGSFVLSGSIESADIQNGTQSYLVESDNVSFKYLYTSSLLSDNDSGDVNWHITDDNSKTVDNISLGSKIESGAIIIQTSVDGTNWINDEIMTDVFETTPIQTGSIYTTNDIQLLNGTYYRFIVAYRERKLNSVTGWGPFKSFHYDCLERCEVYEFYLESRDSYEYQASNNNRRALGAPVNAGSHNGFDSVDDITSSDPHYGWQLGRFFISGYTDLSQNPDGSYTFQKTLNDRIELSFSLEQDINCLNGNSDLIINNDGDGTDGYFQTDRNIKFERGALIIRHTDYQGIQSEPQIYTNFLEANTRAGADTRVSLFEEGDYEVALDYEICNQYGWDTYENYRIFIRFSVRNGNAMVFPFDSSTRSELRSLSTTPNGFYLDLARSRYLKIFVKRYILNDTGTGLDSRGNNPARDLQQYTDEGIYLIYAVNPTTGLKTRKIICVGENAELNNYFSRVVVRNPSILTEE